MEINLNLKFQSVFYNYCKIIALDHKKTVPELIKELLEQEIRKSMFVFPENDLSDLYGFKEFKKRKKRFKTNTRATPARDRLQKK